MNDQLRDLWNKDDPTELETCILWVADDETPAALKQAKKGLQELAAKNAALEAAEKALKLIADKKNWVNNNGEIVWNDFSGNEFMTEHAINIASAALAAIQKAKP
jgi:hypothetical protein